MLLPLVSGHDNGKLRDTEKLSFNGLTITLLLHLTHRLGAGFLCRTSSSVKHPWLLGGDPVQGIRGGCVEAGDGVGRLGGHGGAGIDGGRLGRGPGPAKVGRLRGAQPGRATATWFTAENRGSVAPPLMRNAWFVSLHPAGLDTPTPPRGRPLRGSRFWPHMIRARDQESPWEGKEDAKTGENAWARGKRKVQPVLDLTVAYAVNCFIIRGNIGATYLPTDYNFISRERKGWYYWIRKLVITEADFF
jgi:hypothetical protein